MAIYVHSHDIPASLLKDVSSVAIDTEAMGLHIGRDRLCLVQLSTGDGNAHLVQIAAEPEPAPNLIALLENPAVLKLFHFARFDVALLKHTFKCALPNIYCTKIASKLTRTYTDRHGLKDLCSEVLGVILNKAQQTSNWSAHDLSEEQKNYAADDVLYLHQLKVYLDHLLAENNRTELASSYFAALQTVVESDLAGFSPEFVLSH